MCAIEQDASGRIIGDCTSPGKVPVAVDIVDD